MDSHPSTHEEAPLTLDEVLRGFDPFGLKRPTTASLREYLAALVDLEVITRPVADLVELVYHRERFGHSPPDDHDLRDALSGLHDATLRLETLEPERREQLAQEMRRRFIPPEPRPAAPSATHAASAPPVRAASAPEPPREAPAEPEPLGPEETRALSAEDVGVQARRRVGLFWAAAAVLWTAAVLVGAYERHDDIRRFVTDAKTRLGWEPPPERKRYRHTRDTDDNQPPAKREVTLLKNMAEQFDSQNRTREAIYAYHLLLLHDPDNALAMNNLAWSLLTTEDMSLRNPTQALDLAKKAVERQPNYVYLDTLAEAWYQNGDPARAVELQERALALGERSTQRAHLERQLKKFQRAAEAAAGATVPPEPAPANTSANVEAAAEPAASATDSPAASPPGDSGSDSADDSPAEPDPPPLPE